jgi:hypothetical protein
MGLTADPREEVGLPPVVSAPEGGGRDRSGVPAFCRGKKSDAPLGRRWDAPVIPEVRREEEDPG